MPGGGSIPVSGGWAVGLQTEVGVPGVWSAHVLQQLDTLWPACHRVMSQAAGQQEGL